MIRVRWAVVALLAGVLVAPAIGADGASGPAAGTRSGERTDANPGSQVATFRMEVRRVLVDVVVTDKQGNPVRGLKKRDFRVKEDGRSQQILSFEYEDGSTPSYVPAKLPPLPTNTFINLPREPERGPLYIVYYDMVNTDREDQMRFHEALLKFVDEAQPGTRIALFVNASGLHLLQGFTSDHALLREAILRKGPGPHIPRVFLYGENYGWEDSGAALTSLTFLSEYLGGIPGKKNLLWLASHFPIPVSASMVGAATAGTNRASPMIAGRGMGGPQFLDLTELQSGMVQKCFSAMMRSQIALYPVDLKGVVVGGPPGAGDSLGEYGQERTIASITGGKAFYSNNHLNEALEDAMKAGESYYELSYAPTNLGEDRPEQHMDLADTARHIEVTLTKKHDYKLSYRMLYYALPEDQSPSPKRKVTLHSRFMAAKATDTLYANIEHGAPMLHDLLFSAQVNPVGAPTMATAQQMEQMEDSPAYFKTRRRDRLQKPPAPVKLQRYRIAYGVFDPQLKALALRHSKPATLEFAVAAYDADGKLLNSMLNEGQATLNADSNGKHGTLFHAEQELDVPPGAAWLRLAVRDRLSDRTGTLEVRLPLNPVPEMNAQKAGH